MKTIFTVCLAWAVIGIAIGQQFSDKNTISKDMSQLKTLRVHNFAGKVNIEGVSGNQLTINYTRRLKSKSARRLEAAKSEIKLENVTENGELIFFIKAPDKKFKIDTDGNGYYNSMNWNKSEDIFEVDYEFEIDVKVPKDKIVYVSTHHKNITVNNIQGNLVARGHHNDIKVTRQGGNASVKTHHGNVEVAYTKNPTQDSYYKTHHGDIKVHFQKGLAAKANLYSHHGEFLTAFDWKIIPMQVSKSTDGKGKKYVSGKGTTVKIGSGGPMQIFKTHHGDIYLLDQ